MQKEVCKALLLSQRISFIFLLFFFIPYYVYAYVGYGAVDNSMGENGDTCFVTNKNSAGNGSLRFCVNAIPDRPVNCSNDGLKIKFNVEGVISLGSNVIIENKGCFSIKGYSAPGNGVTIRNHGFVLRNVKEGRISHLRMRNMDNVPAIRITNGSKKLIINNISFTSFKDDDYHMVIHENSSDITVQKCLIAYTQPGFSDSLGVLVDSGAERLTFWRNAFINISRESLYTDAGGVRIDFINNYVRDWDDHGVFLRFRPETNVIGNRFEQENFPQGSSLDGLIMAQDDTDDFTYTEDNNFIRREGNRNNEYNIGGAVHIINSSDVENTVLGNVGADPNDSIDNAIIN